MYQFAITTDICEKRHVSTSDEIPQELQRLQDEISSFVIIEVSPAIGGVNFIQVQNLRYKKGLFSREFVDLYGMELNISEADGSVKQYSSAGDFQDVKDIFVAFIDRNKTPNYATWTDITEEVVR